MSRNNFDKTPLKEDEENKDEAWRIEGPGTGEQEEEGGEERWKGKMEEEEELK